GRRHRLVRRRSPRAGRPRRRAPQCPPPARIARPARPRVSLMTTLAQAIASGPLLLDGAMGSLLYERGVLHTRSYDELNLSQPELIRTVHRDYVQAGAELIETNTFGANRMALARHGLVEQAAEINRAAVAIAREA